MAPEQSAGEVDARADQFSFCVALWRALFGVAPYAGDDLITLATAALDGALVPPPPAVRSRVTPQVRAALERGLAGDPDARFPSMRALLDAIDTRPPRRRAAWVVGGVAIAATAGVVVWMAARSSSDGATAAPDPCPAPSDRVAAVWSPSRAAALRATMTRIDPAIGAQRHAAAEAILDRATSGWRDMHVDACRATRVARTQPDNVLDARIRCLDDWLDRAASSIAGLERAADPRALERAVKRVGTLPAIDHCADLEALRASSELPVAAEQRREALAILDELDRIDDARHGGKLETLPAEAEAVLARARAFGAPRLVVHALAVRWRIANAVADIVTSTKVLEELTTTAARAGDHVEEARAWAALARLTAGSHGQPDEAEVMITAARAASARIGDPPRVLADVIVSHADVQIFAGQYERALATLGELRGVLIGLGAERPGSPYGPKLAMALRMTAKVYWYADRQEEAVPVLREAIALFDRIWGPETSESAACRLDLSNQLRELARYEEAEREARDGVRVTEAVLGESPPLAIFLMSHADTLGFLDRRDEALALAERAAAIAVKTLPPGAPQRLLIDMELASHYDGAGKLRESLDRYIAAFATVPADDEFTDINLAAWWMNRADVEFRLGMCKESMAHYRKAGEIGRAIQGDKSNYLGSALRGEATCLRKLGRHEQAITVLEQSMAYDFPPYLAFDVARARGFLGRLLAERRTGAERARGIAMVRAALDEMRTLPDPEIPDHPDRKALEAWLAERDQGAKPTTR
jgi:tetratricopeptide (TPR) repeat protein